ncbi:MAG: thioredoxin domain-containing protein [Candidatus Sumerlaea sp.]|uniref:Thymidylate kinase n=1 Tax=Sumerlaea chitinivorans TaxID=2250252 RepID=A0A2Z4Y4A8_SUMC1|nr:Thymidylate kinase [Candidatus Sumerlaea chitinivorans]GIX44205.1 MAG: thioredoxin domain-containing protein [Candidatus Sumerlaea sp.]
MSYEPHHAGKPRQPNRLSKETSPYLRQHQYNPVDWYPWGEEAFEKAKREDKPLLISIGYSSCHWCHVMERECFDNEAIAQLINETVVPVKVDREERPDVDAVYMNVCVALNGQGGWPLNVFVTPSLQPFFAGTYFPPEDRYGRPGFPTLLSRIASLWRENRDAILTQADTMTRELRRLLADAPAGPIQPDVFTKVVTHALREFDPRYGGFGSAPKFPPDQLLALLQIIYHDSRDAKVLGMIRATLDGMAHGGIYDHLAGGFARYSVDDEWHVPHFEKMLYNQALLVPVYLDMFLQTSEPPYARVARETLDWLLRSMRDPSGMFYSALDADSEGVEGKYYVWSRSEILQVLGRSDGELACEYFDVTPEGNWEDGKSVLRVLIPDEQFAEVHNMELQAWKDKLASIRERLFAAREQKIPPALDSKCLTSWNGLTISALAKGGAVLGESRFVQAAREAAEFILERLWEPPHRLLRVYCDGVAKIPGMLDDYTYLAAGLLDLYEVSGEARYFNAAYKLMAAAKDRFWAGDGYYFSEATDAQLPFRLKEFHDGALPSPNSVAVMNLLRLAELTGEMPLREMAEAVLDTVGARASQAPTAYASMLKAYRFLCGANVSVVVTGGTGSPESEAMLWTISRVFHPSRVVAFNDGASDVPALARDYRPSAGEAHAYVCVDRACQPPAASPRELEQLLRSIS